MLMKKATSLFDNAYFQQWTFMTFCDGLDMLWFDTKIQGYTIHKTSKLGHGLRLNHRSKEVSGLEFGKLSTLY